MTLDFINRNISFTLQKSLLDTDIQIKLVQCPGNWVSYWSEKIKAMQDKGVAISFHQ